MKLRTKVTLFFAVFFFTVITAMVVYVELVVSDTLKKQTVHNFRIIAEQSEGTYFAFLNSMKTRVVDWTSDSTIRETARHLLVTPEGSLSRIRLAEEFATYIRGKKMPYDTSIFAVDLLDKNGIVVASTEADRIGKDEKNELSSDGRKTHRFSDAIESKSGEVYFSSIEFAYENPKPFIGVMTRLSVPSESGELQPIDAVVLVYFENTEQIAEALGAGVGIQSIKTVSRVSSQAFLESYNTSDIYIINSAKLMVTPSRYIQDVGLHQVVDSLPVRECFENGKEINGEYDNYQGLRVLGASMCFTDNGSMLLVEIQKAEVFAPVSTLTRNTIAGGLFLLAFGIIIASLFVRRPLSRLDDVVLVAKRVSEGDLDARVKVQTSDEIGYLAGMFNSMIVSIRGTQKQLEESKREIEEKALFLEQDLDEHKKQQELLERSKKATINILEDVWSLKTKLQSESSRLQTIITSVGAGIILIDAERKIVLVNPKAVEMFAIPEEELLGKDLRLIMKLWRGKEKELPLVEWPTEEIFLSMSTVVTTLADEIFFSTENQKKQIPVTLSASPLVGNISGGGVLIIRDATADYMLDEAKSGFISVASHQLRTPLTSIRWYSEMLLSEDVGPLNEAQRDFMSEVHNGSERLYQTVDLLLGISRVESGKIKTEKQNINLSMFTAEIAKELASQIEEKEIVLSVAPPAGDPAIVLLDPLTLRQVILNLVSNAIRYTKTKNGVIDITWRNNETGDAVIYSVRDNGIGIPLLAQNRIFSKFFRAENARTQVPDGSGLGLALVKELVESWGGKVWFETEEGKGSTFHFTILLEKKQ